MHGPLNVKLFSNICQLRVITSPTLQTVFSFSIKTSPDQTVAVSAAIDKQAHFLILKTKSRRPASCIHVSDKPSIPLH